MFQHIVVGLDLAVHDQLVSDRLSDASAAALRRALWLAPRIGAPLHLVYALDLSPKAQWLIEHADTKLTILAAANRQLQRYSDQARDQGVAVTARAAIGRPWMVVLHELAQYEQALVVVGTHHHGHWGGMLAGSTCNKLLAKCPVPLWVVDPEDVDELQRILVATDLSEVSDQLIDLAARVAQLAGSTLHILHVIDSQVGQLTSVHREAEERLRELERQLEEDARQGLSQKVQRSGLKSESGSLHTHLASGDPVATIARYVEELQVQLLVMGTLGHSHGIPGMLMGTTAERLLCRLRCSLLTAKPSGFRSPIQLAAQPTP